MKNIIIITPVYNDWESFTKLIDEIDKVILSFKDISLKLDTTLLISFISFVKDSQSL